MWLERLHLDIAAPLMPNAPAALCSMPEDLMSALNQVLAEEGKAKAVAFDEIDKAPEEKKRGITIATVGHILIITLSF